MFSSRLAKRKGFLVLSLVACLCTLGAGYVLWGSVQTDSLDSLRQQVDRWQTVLTVSRFLLIAVLAVGWPYLISLLITLGLISESRRQRLKNQRWRIIAWLIVLELIVGQGIFVKLLALFTGKYP